MNCESVNLDVFGLNSGTCPNLAGSKRKLL
jgi:hypothetical protein